VASATLGYAVIGGTMPPPPPTTAIFKSFSWGYIPPKKHKKTQSLSSFFRLPPLLPAAFFDRLGFSLRLPIALNCLKTAINDKIKFYTINTNRGSFL
jgi:hypothetical protein